jgi:hypothetical protein
MRRRKSYYNTNDISKQEYYKIELKPIKVDKNIFDVIAEKYGDTKALNFIQYTLMSYGSLTGFFELIDPNNKYTKDEANKMIERFIELNGEDLIYTGNDDGNIYDFLNEI